MNEGNIRVEVKEDGGEEEGRIVLKNGLIMKGR